MDLEATLRDLAPRVLRYCTGYVGDPSLGEDLAQESLAALIRSWRTSGPPASPDAFVSAIAKRRSRRALFRRRLVAPLELALDRHSAAPDPERTTIANDRRRHLLAAIRHLPRIEREAILLVVGAGKKVHEAADLSGVSVSAMKMRLSRARQRPLLVAPIPTPTWRWTVWTRTFLLRFSGRPRPRAAR